MLGFGLEGAAGFRDSKDEFLSLRNFCATEVVFNAIAKTDKWPRIVSRIVIHSSHFRNLWRCRLDLERCPGFWVDSNWDRRVVPRFPICFSSNGTPLDLIPSSATPNRFDFILESGTFRVKSLAVLTASAGAGIDSFSMIV